MMQIDMDSLWRTENELRERVECAPANAEARRDLAWCLILLAMYQAGIEQTSGRRPAEHDQGRSGLSDIVDNSTDPQKPASRRDSRSSEQLLHEHLWHAQVLNMLPSARQLAGPMLYDLGFGQLVGASLLSSQVKSKYEAAMLRLISDLQDPSV